MRVLSLILAIILLLGGVSILWLDYDFSGRWPVPFLGGQTSWQWTYLSIDLRDWTCSVGSRKPGAFNMRLTWLGAVATFGGFAALWYVVHRRRRERRIRQQIRNQEGKDDKKGGSHRSCSI